MAVSQTISLSHTGGSVALSDTVVTTGELATEANIALAASTTDQQENIAFNHTNLRMIYIKSDVTISLETNTNNHAGGDVFTITAGVPFYWHYQSGITLPFSAAVTTTFWTNATSDAATIYMRTLVA